MKRLIPVLALALILTLNAWEDASSRRRSASRIDDVQFDHPWGGEEHIITPPVNSSARPPVNDNVTIIQIFKNLNYKMFFNGAGFLNLEFGKTTTTSTITNPTVAGPNTTTNQAGNQKGTNQ